MAFFAKLPTAAESRQRGLPVAEAVFRAAGKSEKRQTGGAGLRGSVAFFTHDTGF